jgi:hypothetical protein
VAAGREPLTASQGDHPARPPLRILGLDAAAALAVPAGRDGEVGADVEEVVLHAREPGPVGLREAGHGEGDAELGVQLVDVAVRLDARVRLAHPAHVAQVGLAAVAEARVDAGQVHRHRAGL